MSAQQSLAFPTTADPAVAATVPRALSGANRNPVAAPEQIQLADAELFYLPRFYDASASAALLQTLLDATPWRQDTLFFGGKAVAVPRLQAWYGERRYAYSGLQLMPLPWTPTLDAIRNDLTALCGLSFNSVLLNYYRDGNDSVAWHSDDERELGPDPQIASLSLGAERKFELKHRTLKQARSHLTLENGSLLLMGSGLQRHWQHRLPKNPGITAPRLNLTFRFIH